MTFFFFVARQKSNSGNNWFGSNEKTPGKKEVVMRNAGKKKEIRQFASEIHLPHPNVEMVPSHLSNRQNVTLCPDRL